MKGMDRSGCSSVVEHQLPKLRVEGSSPFTRSTFLNVCPQFSPGVQFVSNPGGDADADGITVFGVRLQVAF